MLSHSLIPSFLHQCTPFCALVPLLMPVPHSHVTLFLMTLHPFPQPYSRFLMPLCSLSFLHHLFPKHPALLLHSVSLSIPVSFTRPHCLPHSSPSFSLFSYFFSYFFFVFSSFSLFSYSSSFPSPLILTSSFSFFFSLSSYYLLPFCLPASSLPLYHVFNVRTLYLTFLCHYFLCPSPL